MKIFKQLFPEQNIMQDPVAQNGLNSWGCQSGHRKSCRLTDDIPTQHNTGICEGQQDWTGTGGWAPFPCSSAATTFILCNFISWGNQTRYKSLNALFCYPQCICGVPCISCYEEAVSKASYDYGLQFLLDSKWSLYYLVTKLCSSFHYSEGKFCWCCSCFADVSTHLFPPLQSFLPY